MIVGVHSMWQKVIVSHKIPERFHAEQKHMGVCWASKQVKA